MIESAEEPPRSGVLVVVPHDPGRDPRISWSVRTCLNLGKTRIAAVRSAGPAAVGAMPDDVALTCGNSWDECGVVTRYFATVAGWLWGRRATQRHIERAAGLAPAADGVLEKADDAVGAAMRLIWVAASYLVIIDALTRVTKTCIDDSVRVVLAHDLLGLAAAVLARGGRDIRIVYDAHEFWPEADSLASPTQRALVQALEARLLASANAVVTITPQMARELESTYGLHGVSVVPNAAPMEIEKRVSPRRAKAHEPMRILFQGSASPLRGIEEVLAVWHLTDPSDVVLTLRCPPGDYLEFLIGKYGHLIESGRMERVEAVEPIDLIDAAASSHVGLIPYLPTNREYRYCCPNKFAEYLQAGLAVLTTDIDFVRSVIERHRCGALYDHRRPESVVEAVTALAADRDALHVMRCRAREAARSAYNWDAVAGPYFAALSGEDGS